ncbi:Transcriptional regulator of ribosomal biogenesis protein [Gryganskiella cystojenkinii]|nr:Transcriptional regulator of ribosomal biogenesis protein [Gryganskiella cystojenkinii]
MDPSSSSFRFESVFDENQSSPSYNSSLDNMHARDFETAFCRDFSCCGQRLTDLHDLLQHYEECHVRFEDDELDEDDELEDEAEQHHYSFRDARNPFGLESRKPIDEDSWSDSDSAPSSPSPTSPSGPSAGSIRRKYRYRSGSASGSTGLGLAFGSDLDAAAIHTQRTSSPLHHLTSQQQQILQSTTAPFFGQPIIHSTHPLFRRPSSGSSEGEVDSSASSLVQLPYRHHSRQLPPSQSMHPYSAAVNSLDAFPATFHGPLKRKALVSLADIYNGDQGDKDIDYTEEVTDLMPAFSNTVVRSKNQQPSGLHINDSSIDLLTEPPTKRQARDQGSVHRQGLAVVGGMAQHSHSASPYPGLSPGIMVSLGAISPLSSRHIYQGHHNPPGGHPNLSSLTTTTPSPYVAAAVDLMRQRDEVYNIIEDLSKTSGNNMDRGDKPYRCSVQGCDKAYKNPNGLKYHNAHGHCSSSGLNESESLETKPYVCTFLECGKRYKNLNGLKYHIEHSHPNLTAALKAHQSGLICNKIFGPFPQAARTIAAALQAVHASPMMMAAANAILASQQAGQDATAESTGSFDSTNNSAARANNTGSGSLESGIESGSKQTLTASKPPYTFAPGQRPVVLGPGSIPGPLQRPSSASILSTNPCQSQASHAARHNAYHMVSTTGPSPPITTTAIETPTTLLSGPCQDFLLQPRPKEVRPTAESLPPHPGWTIERESVVSAIAPALGSASAIPAINS